MRIKIFILVFYAFLSACGFKAVDQSNLQNYSIKELKINGDKKISYLVRNNLKKGNKNAANNLILEINFEKKKNIKEKNIKNEITKYEIILYTNVKFEMINKKISSNFSFEEKGEYNVEKKHSSTINNEKSIIKDLSKKASRTISKNLELKLNDI